MNADYSDEQYHSDEQYRRGAFAFARFRERMLEASPIARFSIAHFDSLPDEIQRAWIATAEAILRRFAHQIVT